MTVKVTLVSISYKMAGKCSKATWLVVVHKDAPTKFIRGAGEEGGGGCFARAANNDKPDVRVYRT